MATVKKKKKVKRMRSGRMGNAERAKLKRARRLKYLIWLFFVLLTAIILISSRPLLASRTVIVTKFGNSYTPGEAADLEFNNKLNQHIDGQVKSKTKEEKAN